MATTRDLILRIQAVVPRATRSSITELIKRKKELKKLLQDIPAEGTEAYEELDQAIRQASNGTDTLADQQARLNQEFAESNAQVRDFNRNLRQGEAAAGSINDLRNRVIQLNRALDNTEIGTEEFRRLTQQSAQLTRELNEAEQASLRFQRNVGNYPSLGNGIISTFKQVGVALIAAFTVDALIDRVRDGLSAVVEIGGDYTAALKQTQAITGVSNQELGGLGATARQTAEDLKTSAIGIVDGFRIVGSERPELLQDAEALGEVTRQTAILAKASQQELEPAAKALTAVLNQFGIEASGTAEAVDILASGSLKGAADIPNISEAIVKFGAVARNTNVGLKESVALIETISGDVKGAEAGTKLRNILLNISNAAVLPEKAQEAFERLGIDIEILSNNALPLQTRLEELAKAQGDINGLTEIFGKQNVAVAATLIENIDKYQNFNEVLGESGTALKQAQTNADNLSGDLNALAVAGEGLAIEIFTALEPAIRALVSSFAGFVNLLSNGVVFIKENSTAFKVLALVLGTVAAAYTTVTIETKLATAGTLLNTTATKAAAIANTAYNTILGILTGNIKLATVATRVLNVVTKLSPWGLIAGLATAAAGAYALFGKETSLTAERQEILNNTLDRSIKEFTREKATLDALFKPLRDDNAAREDKEEATQKILNQYGDYLPALDKEKGQLQDIEAAYNAISDAILDNIIRKEQSAVAEQLLQRQINTARALQKIEEENLTGPLFERIREKALFEQQAIRQELEALPTTFEQIADKVKKSLEGIDVGAAVGTGAGEEDFNDDGGRENGETERKAKERVKKLQKKIAEERLKVLKEEAKERKDFVAETEEEIEDLRLENLEIGLNKRLQTLEEGGRTAIQILQNQLEAEKQIEDERANILDENLQRVQSRLENLQGNAGIVAGNINVITDVIKNSAQERIDALTAESEERQRQIELSGLDSEQKQAAIRREQQLLDEALAKDERRKQRALAIEQKTAAAINLINQAVTITSSVRAIASAAATPPFIPAGLIAISTAIAAIASAVASARALAKFETGGPVDEGPRTYKQGSGRGGYLNFGKKHTQGGTVIEAQIGEYVLNHKAYEMFPDEIEWMNEMGIKKMRGQGTNLNRIAAISRVPQVRPPTFQAGGPIGVNSPTTIVQNDLTGVARQVGSIKKELRSLGSSITDQQVILSRRDVVEEEEREEKQFDKFTTFID